MVEWGALLVGGGGWGQGWGWGTRAGAGWVFWGRTAVQGKSSRDVFDVVVSVAGAGFGFAPGMGLEVTLNVRPLGCRE